MTAIETAATQPGDPARGEGTWHAARRQIRLIAPHHARVALLFAAIGVVLAAAYVLWGSSESFEFYRTASASDRQGVVAYGALLAHIAVTAFEYVALILMAVFGWRQARQLSGFLALGSSRRAFLAARATIILTISVCLGLVAAAGFQADRLLMQDEWYEVAPRTEPISHLYGDATSFFAVAADGALLAVAFAATGFLIGSAIARLTGIRAVIVALLGLVPLGAMQLVSRLWAKAFVVGDGFVPFDWLLRRPRQLPQWVVVHAHTWWLTAIVAGSCLAAVAVLCWGCLAITDRLAIEPAQA